MSKKLVLEVLKKKKSVVKVPKKPLQKVDLSKLDPEKLAFVIGVAIGVVKKQGEGYATLEMHLKNLGFDPNDYPKPGDYRITSKVFNQAGLKEGL